MKHTRKRVFQFKMDCFQSHSIIKHTSINKRLLFSQNSHLPRLSVIKHTLHAELISLPNDNFFDLTKLKALADHKINVAQNEDMRENNVYWHFLFFPAMFSKGLHTILKGRDCVVSGQLLTK